MARSRHRSSIRKEIEEVYPALSFWYGLSFTELYTMPRWSIRMYIKSLDQLQAELEFMMTSAASYAHLKRSAQRRSASKLKKRMRAGRPSTVVAKDQYQDTLKSAGIGYRVVEKK